MKNSMQHIGHARKTDARDRATRVLISILSCLSCTLMLMIGPANARVPDARAQGILDFIGAIESNGYDDVYRGVAAQPPQPLTTMTVAEVLAWQESIDARSRSEAAGKYQIIEDTLRELVDQGVVAPGALFNPATQDALALHLLERRGYDPARTDYDRMGDAIAREWAALPVCTGYRAGRSYYDGLNGNTARTTCDTWLAVLADSHDPLVVADAIALSALVTAARDANASDLAIFLDDVRETFLDLAGDLTGIALSLLYSLLVIEWAMTTARQVAQGAGLQTYLSTLFQRIAIAATFIFLINLSNYSDLVIASAEALLDISTTGASIDVIDLFDGLLALVYDLFGRSWWSIPDKLASIVILFVGAILIGVIVTAYIEVYISFAAAIIALGFAGWTGTRYIAIRYLKFAAIKTMYLFSALFCGALMSSLVSFDLDNNTGNPVFLAGILVILSILITSIPEAIEQAMTGRTSSSASASVGGFIRGLFLNSLTGGARRGWNRIQGKK